MNASRHSKTKNKPSAASKSQKNGVVRIIGGQMGGRKLKFADADGLRPTLDRIRETVFNWLARDIGGSDCLDLFAGSGALGFEALSRGAARVTLVEANPKVANDLKANIKLLNADKVQLELKSAAQFLTDCQQQFDVVFLDPPFGHDLLADTLAQLQPHLKPHGLVYIEQEKSNQPFVPIDGWQQLKFKQTSSFCYALYQRQ